MPMTPDVARALWDLHSTARLSDDSVEVVQTVLDIPDFTEEPEPEETSSASTSTTTGGKKT